MAFHRSLVRIDAKIRLSPFVQVFTSDRIEGRVDFGLSIQLKQWGEMNEHHHPLMVEPAGSLIIKLNTRRQLRALWASKADVSEELAKIASALGLDFAWTMYQFQNSAYFGTLWQTIEDQLEQQGWSVTWPPADIVQVIPALKREISMLASELQSI
jgi:hypothetical protein